MSLDRVEIFEWLVTNRVPRAVGEGENGGEVRRVRLTQVSRY